MSKATTVDAYLAELPEERRQVVAAVRDLIIRNLPKGYRETISSGMISYCVPLDDYPDTYNKQPLCYAALAAQKNYYALYLMSCYSGDQEQALRDGFAKAGKKLDMGKSCVRFKKLEDLPLDVIGKVIGSTPPQEFTQQYEASRAR
ncbi:MAG TPA: DUF1801 domain-containing protein [Thermoanaerobaculia bacterium]